jgi:hypothetical protein
MTAQDGGVREPRARLRTVLAIARRLAGYRGRSSVTWHGQGFTYTLTTVRDPGADPATVDVDADPTDGDLGGDEPIAPRIAELADLLRVLP